MIVTVKQIKSQVNREWSDIKDARYKGTKHSIVAFYDKYGTITTGLTEEEAKEIGEKIDKDLRNTSPFWHDYRVVLTSKELKLNLNNVEDLIKYKLLLAHPLVKNSINDVNPKALYVIHNEEEDAKNVNIKAEVKLKAYNSFSKLTIVEKKDILRLYKGYRNTDNVSDSVIEAQLYNEMERDFAKFVGLVEDKHRNMKIFLKDLVVAKVLRKNKNAYYYGDDILGHDEESTISHLDSPENQSLKLALMKELKSTKK